MERYLDFVSVWGPFARCVERLAANLLDPYFLPPSPSYQLGSCVDALLWGDIIGRVRCSAGSTAKYHAMTPTSNSRLLRVPTPRSRSSLTLLIALQTFDQTEFVFDSIERVESGAVRRAEKEGEGGRWRGWRAVEGNGWKTVAKWNKR